MNILQAFTLDTPVGPFSVAINATPSIVATAFGPVSRLSSRLRVCHVLRDKPPHAKIARQVREYFAGKRREFDLDLAPTGTAFQESVWEALRKIPYGETRSYGELARSIGRPKAARAVGAANGANPISLFIPCHRVIGADGSLTGFAFGEAIKEKLLRHEGALSPALV